MKEGRKEIGGRDERRARRKPFQGPKVLLPPSPVQGPPSGNQDQGVSVTPAPYSEVSRLRLPQVLVTNLAAFTRPGGCCGPCHASP